VVGVQQTGSVDAILGHSVFSYGTTDASVECARDKSVADDAADDVTDDTYNATDDAPDDDDRI
jgi:ApbE superfamily uncharacterized protein (UPF0280 family)